MTQFRFRQAKLRRKIGRTLKRTGVSSRYEKRLPLIAIERDSVGKTIRDWVTLLLLIATTFGVFWQLEEMMKVYLPIRQTAEATKESFAAVQRAFVTAKQLGWDGDIAPTNELFYFVLENSGNTPTRNLEVYVSFQFDINEINSPPSPNRVRPIFAPDDPIPYFESVKRDFPPQPVVIAPKGLVPINFGGPTKSQLDNMAKVRADGYVFGVAYYDDVFKDSTRHTSKFCFVVQPVKDGDRTKLVSGLCQHWNCADEECETDKARYEQMRYQMILSHRK
jgi:hypothetical protein